MAIRAGVDTGGTFTDVVIRGDDGALRVLKLPSTPDDPARAVIEGLRGQSGAEVVHSTTVATNALLERRGGPTVLVTTRGFEDVLVLGRQARPELYALHPVLPPPLCDDAHRLGIDERLDAQGRVLRAPTAEALAQLVEQVRALNPASVAVCLLHAYLNPAHEQAVARALAPLNLPLSLSSEVLPLPREFERTSTTVVDAYVRPVISPYLSRVAGAVKSLRIMQSNGGATSAAESVPVRTLLSGPAAGVVGALAVARAAGISDAITFDMGGTSTDVALIAGGEVAISDEAEIGGCPLQLPMMAVHTVGAGGGSIARVDSGGALKVGPRSAGAHPGPACYGRGGELPTVTDANLVLGRLSASHFLGGAMTLDVARARAVLTALGQSLGKPPEAAAEDVIAVADAVMARAIKTISVERGRDPAGFTLMPFGGAGAMHACAVARELGMKRVLVPPSPGLLCAYGALTADVTHDRIEARTDVVRTGDDAALFDAGFARLESQAHALLERDRVAASDRVLTRSCALRYRGQSFELQLPARGDLCAAFHAAHQERYGHALPEREVELCSLRVRALGRTAVIAPPTENRDAGEALLGRHTAIFGGRAHGAAIWSRRRLAPGVAISGPGIIVEYSATTVLLPDVRAEVHESGALLLEV